MFHFSKPLRRKGLLRRAFNIAAPVLVGASAMACDLLPSHAPRELTPEESGIAAARYPGMDTTAVRIVRGDCFSGTAPVESIDSTFWICDSKHYSKNYGGEAPDAAKTQLFQQGLRAVADSQLKTTIGAQGRALTEGEAAGARGAYNYIDAAAIRITYGNCSPGVTNMEFFDSWIAVCAPELYAPDYNRENPQAERTSAFWQGMARMAHNQIRAQIGQNGRPLTPGEETIAKGIYGGLNAKSVRVTYGTCAPENKGMALSGSSIGVCAPEVYSSDYSQEDPGAWKTGAFRQELTAAARSQIARQNGNRQEAQGQPISRALTRGEKAVLRNATSGIDTQKLRVELGACENPELKMEFTGVAFRACDLPHYEQDYIHSKTDGNFDIYAAAASIAAQEHTLSRPGRALTSGEAALGRRFYEGFNPDKVRIREGCPAGVRFAMWTYPTEIFSCRPEYNSEDYSRESSRAKTGAFSQMLKWVAEQQIGSAAPLENGPPRPLTEGERAVVVTAFGAAYNPAPVRVTVGPCHFDHSFMEAQGNDVTICNPGGYKEDYAPEKAEHHDAARISSFFHELYHTLQHQMDRNRTPLLRSACNPNDPYSYSLSLENKMEDFCYEQQPTLFGDYVALFLNPHHAFPSGDKTTPEFAALLQKIVEDKFPGARELRLAMEQKEGKVVPVVTLPRPGA